MFSYGSGLTATMFSSYQPPFSLSNIAKVMDVDEKLKSRHEFPLEKFVDTMQLMEHRYGAEDFVTTAAFYLQAVTISLKLTPCTEDSTLRRLDWVQPSRLPKTGHWPMVAENLFHLLL